MYDIFVKGEIWFHRALSADRSCATVQAADKFLKLEKDRDVLWFQLRKRKWSMAFIPKDLTFWIQVLKEPIPYSCFWNENFCFGSWAGGWWGGGGRSQLLKQNCHSTLILFLRVKGPEYHERILKPLFLDCKRVPCSRQGLVKRAWLESGTKQKGPCCLC